MQKRFRLLFTVYAFNVACSGSTALNAESSKAPTTAPATERTSEKDSGSGKADDDLRVVPPEVVSGAYLTCVDSGTGTTPPPGKIHHGCAAVKADGITHVDLKHFKTTWSTEDIISGSDVPMIDIPLPAESKFDSIFEISADAVQRGIRSHLKILGGGNSSAELQTRGKCIINGRVVSCGPNTDGPDATAGSGEGS